jgi:putative SOS response-associated peptidase YedK
MCGRYALHANPDVVALQFGLDVLPEFKASYNVCPGTDVLVVRRGHKASLLRWGAGNKLINARAETVDERPAFRNAFRQWRCLVPASGFYEWQSVAGKKRPWYVLPRANGRAEPGAADPTARLFALGGIVLLWQGVRSVAIVTTAANELMSSIHERMPVIIPPEQYAAWLSPGDATALLQPYPADRMQAHPVSLRVNAPANDDEALLQPI